MSLQLLIPMKHAGEGCCCLSCFASASGVSRIVRHSQSVNTLFSHLPEAKKAQKGEKGLLNPDSFLHSREKRVRHLTISKERRRTVSGA